ncbi:hypothetical protein PWT90_00326 [Aphanocladium album]|nr:hypothetical protein PWT90_00326 [Aphanocladium album]
MYIRRGVSEAESLTPAPRAPAYGRIQGGEPVVADSSDAFGQTAGIFAKLAKRQFSSDPVQNTNSSIGLAVGIVLGLFLIGTFAFLWVYRYSIRCTSRKKRRSKSSKSSKASSDNGSEAAPAAEEASAGEEAPAGEEAETGEEAEAAPAKEA